MYNNNNDTAIYKAP